MPFGTASRVADSIEPCTPHLTILWTSEDVDGFAVALVHTGLPETVNDRTDEADWNVRPLSATCEPFSVMAL